MIRLQNLPQNLFLQSLSIESRNAILRSAQSVSLPLKTVLQEQETIPQHAYFVETGMASVVISMSEGGSAEVALIGREGLAGSFSLLGSALPPTQCFMQIAGSGYRVPMGDLRRLFCSSEEIRTRVLDFVQQQSMTTSQLAACNRLHELEPRLARWLLMVQDRVQDDVLNLTQEFIAQMLGTFRPTVAVAAGVLQRAGLIEYARGRVRIVSREHLMAASCDCYPVTQRLLQGLYTESFRSSMSLGI